MGRKRIQIVAETTIDGPAVITNGPIALIGRSVDIKQGYKSNSVLVSEVVSRNRGGLQVESLFDHLTIPFPYDETDHGICPGGILQPDPELDTVLLAAHQTHIYDELHEDAYDSMEAKIAETATAIEYDNEFLEYAVSAMEAV